MPRKDHIDSPAALYHFIVRGLIEERFLTISFWREDFQSPQTLFATFEEWG